MEGTIKLSYASPVEALLLSGRNNSGQRVRVPEALGSLLYEMIRSEVRLAAALSEIIRFGIVGVACEITGTIANFQLWWPLSWLIYFGKAGITPVRPLIPVPIPIIGGLTDVMPALPKWISLDRDHQS